MKKIIVTGLLLLITASGFAQLHIDIRAGATASTFGNEHLKIGFRAGVGAEYLFNDHAGLRTGLFYSVKGATSSSNPFNYSAKNATRLSYIDLPVEAVYQFRIASKTHLAIHAGPYLACLVDSSNPQAATWLPASGMQASPPASISSSATSSSAPRSSMD